MFICKKYNKCGKMMKKITQEDIAKKLNITRTTVARALNNNGYVEASLREKILLTAQEMGYKTNLIAKTLAKKGGWNIYCFIVSYNEAYARQMEAGLRSVEKEFQHYGFTLHVVRNNPDQPELQVENLEQVLKTKVVDGLIIAPMLNDKINQILDTYAKKNLPISSLTERLDNDRNLFHVGSNSFEGGAIGADLLSKLMGSKGKIVVINAFNEFEALSLRYQGFVQEIQKYPGIEVVETIYVDHIKDSYEAAKKALAAYPDLSGMYTNTEVVYLSHAIKEAGRREIQLVGNDLNNEIKELIYNGYLQVALHARPYFQGYLSGKYMFNYLLNSIHPKRFETYVGFDIVTKANLHVEDSFVILTNG